MIFGQEYCLVKLVVRGRVELPTFRFSGWRTSCTLPLTERESSPRPSSLDQIWTKQRNVSWSAQLASLWTHGLRIRDRAR
jgi:hypothetical protein